MFSPLLMIAAYAGWPMATYIYCRRCRRTSTGSAVFSAVCVLLIALYVGITLMDVYLTPRRPQRSFDGLLLSLIIVWFSAPYVAVIVWVGYRFFSRRDASPPNI
jgi:hypothetical protein